MVVHPSIVIDWNTVSIARPILSKFIIPLKGPIHPERHSIVILGLLFLGHVRPFEGAAFLSGIIHGTSTLYSGFPKSFLRVYYLKTGVI